MTTIRLAALVFAAGFTLACSPSSSPTAPAEWDDSALDKPAWSVAPERGAEFRAAYPFRYYSGAEQSERLVIRDADAWAELWGRLSASIAPTPPLPAVDFATEMLLFVSQGTQNNGGFGIEVKHVTQSSGVLQVLVGTYSPGSNCVTTQALTNPSDAVIVPRTELAVVFLERHRVRACR